jgi:hypothetical protein
MAENPDASAWRRLLEALALGVALYGFAAWVYVAVSAIVVPNTLHMPLWHLTRWPREDTFGSISFALSFCAFVTYRMLARSGR